MINTQTSTQTSPRKSVKLDNLRRYLIWSVSILRWVGYYMHKNRCISFTKIPMLPYALRLKISTWWISANPPRSTDQMAGALSVCEQLLSWYSVDNPPSTALELSPPKSVEICQDDWFSARLGYGIPTGTGNININEYEYGKLKTTDTMVMFY